MINKRDLLKRKLKQLNDLLYCASCGVKGHMHIKNNMRLCDTCVTLENVKREYNSNTGERIHG